MTTFRYLFPLSTYSSIPIRDTNSNTTNKFMASDSRCSQRLLDCWLCFVYTSECLPLASGQFSCFTVPSTCCGGVQGKPAQLGSVVKAVKQRFGLEYVYCWHGLPAYWSGVAIPEEAPGVAR